MSNYLSVDDAMTNLHVAINSALNQMQNRVQESACWTVDELNHETKMFIQGSDPGVSLAQIFEAGACFAAERILAAVTPQPAEGATAGETSPGMAGG
jgi:hypothetical protein